MFQRTQRCLAILLAVGLGASAAACGRYFEDEEAALPNVFELPAKTGVRVTLDGPEPSDLKAGESFAGVLATPLYYRPEAIDKEGRTFKRDEYLIAVQGAPVYGTIVEIEDPENSETRVAAKLTSITFHGGRSFEVDTLPVPVGGEPPEGLIFQLTEPVDVALVIEQRLAEDKRRD